MLFLDFQFLTGSVYIIFELILAHAARHARVLVDPGHGCPTAGYVVRPPRL